MTPRESSLWGPSKTSTNSSGSTFLSVLLALMSNSLVHAISLTQRKYRSSMEKKLLRVIPSGPLFWKRSCFCSGVMMRPARPSRWRLKVFSGMRSPPLPASSANSASAETERAWIAFRRATETWPPFASVSWSQAAFTLSKTALAFFSIASTRCLCLANSCLASAHGPLAAFPTRPSLDLRQARASATAAETPSAAAVASLRTVSGLATESSSDSPTEVKGVAACSSFCSAAWVLSSCSVTAARTSEAALRSFFSSCFLLSISSLLECSRLPSSTFFWSCSSLERRRLTLGRSFDSSALASARGPCWHSRSSVLLEVMKEDVLDRVACVLAIVLSSLLMKEVYAVNGLKEVPPWLPCMVTQPVLPSLSTLTSMRMRPMASRDFCSPRDSTTSSTRSVSMVLLWDRSKPSVRDTSCVQMYRSRNISTKSALLTMPSLSESMCSKTAWRCSDENARSGREQSSGTLSR
mmetsp:Transcript_108654/g.339852  ORF Transcript_108654/g.339852 Transcript_108654/m.339852 type:complete len:466 (-) Transcript_108654:417-1814(-)